MSTRFMTADEVSALDKWYLIDAAGQVLGRVATKVATILSGKHRPHYAPFLVTGDHVVIINADKIKLTGQKLDQKVYRHHTLYPGGLKEIGARRFWIRSPRILFSKPSLACFPRTSYANAW
jgi:large subunit ribosomal protein L13